MLTISKLTGENINFVCDHLSERSLREMEVFGIDTVQLRVHLDSFIDDKWSLCFYQNAIPCAIMRIGSLDGVSKQFSSLFVYVDGITNMQWRRMTRAIKDILPGAIMAGVYIEFQALIDAGDESIDLWYRSLGFTVREENGRVKTYAIGG